jgi:hypothetical protein
MLTHNTHNRQTTTTLAGSELAIPASEQLQTHALHHAATVIGSSYHLLQLNPLTPNDLQRRHAVSPLKIKIPNKNMHEKPKKKTQIIHSVY